MKTSDIKIGDKLFLASYSMAVEVVRFWDDGSITVRGPSGGVVEVQAENLSPLPTIPADAMILGRVHVCGAYVEVVEVTAEGEYTGRDLFLMNFGRKADTIIARLQDKAQRMNISLVNIQDGRIQL